MRTATSFDVIEDEALDLPAIDLTAADAAGWNLGWDRRTFEERYAELGFGLGTVPRLQRRDDAWWETPLGLMACVVGILVLLWISTAAG
jgi:hypothetical protein